LVLVHLHHRIQSFLEGETVCSEPHHRQENMGAVAGFFVSSDLEHFWNIAGVDIVSRGGAGVASQDGKILAGNS
jgi:hypothetical protein